MAIGLAVPPPASAQDSPTLRVTLDYLRDKITAQGPIYFSSQVHDSSNNQDWVNQFRNETSNVSIDVGACKISYHWRAESNGKVAQELDTWFFFSGIQEVQVKNMEDVLAEADAKAGHPTWSSQVHPEVYAVRAFRDGGVSYEFDFTDEDVAGRVAKALEHAAELCGGGAENQPF